MRLGRIEEGQRRIRLECEIQCISCSKRVPGGIVVADGFDKTDEFHRMLEDLRETYLCGICRDAKRIEEAERAGRTTGDA
ncbi:MAG: hypothetical protein J4F28_02985 [Nitrosopumilaceae archaeon]|nr:hypothetical protein [Nitrosopumilaceae archaeon]